MGFSLASQISTNYHSFLRISHQTTQKFLLFDGKNRSKLGFKASELEHLSRNLVLCKLEYKDFEERSSPNEVKKEIEDCYKLIHRLGRGVVYLGSSRMGPDHPHYTQALELGREIAGLLDCTTWSGAGPGLMDAVTQGALQAQKPVGGFKIGKEAGEWTASNFHAYLPSETYLTCRFFSARKHGLVDAVVRASGSERTAVVALPGGIGTLDEMFEIMALIQLERIGSSLPVPFLLMNYDSFYEKLLEFLDDCEEWGTLSKGEVSSLWKVCDNNTEALGHLVQFYGISYCDEDRKTKSENEFRAIL
ncbi:hypothetical protein ACH5RR_038029 [Cinchona calisaya]|uniref:Cytokinin riboside 5'-monophosphate phosphoribohydrolase n=1 Tax=Cinchona calisaya TaxID=153742 RepID=A0ABD2YBI9_9GENT